MHTHLFSCIFQGSALPQVVQICSATDKYVWLSILFVYKGGLLVVGVFLAWETRGVHLKHLNDSKLIGASIYGIVVLSVAMAAIGILLQSAVNTRYGVIGALLLLGNTSLLCLIFAPKVIWTHSMKTVRSLYHWQVYGVWNKDSEQASSTQDGIKNPPKDTATVAQLQMEIITLKKQLEKVYSCAIMYTCSLTHRCLLQMTHHTVEAERETVK